MHFMTLITWAAFFSPAMVSWGQARTQAPQPVHTSGSIQYSMRGLHTPAGQRFS